MIPNLNQDLNCIENCMGEFNNCQEGLNILSAAFPVKNNHDFSDLVLESIRQPESFDVYVFSSLINDIDEELGSSSDCLRAIESTPCDNRPSSDSRCHQVADQIEIAQLPDHSDESSSILSASLRDDTVNKGIVRAMIKFYKQFFRPLWSLRKRKSYAHFKRIMSHISTQKLVSGMQQDYDEYLASCNYSESQISQMQANLTITLLMMICSKFQSKRFEAFYDSSSAKHLLDDVSCKYSHKKMKGILRNREIKFLFKYFVENNFDSFVSQYEGIQKKKFYNALMSIYHQI